MKSQTGYHALHLNLLGSFEAVSSGGYRGITHVEVFTDPPTQLRQARIALAGEFESQMVAATTSHAEAVGNRPREGSRSTPEPPIEMGRIPSVKGLEESPRKLSEPEAEFLTESEVQEISGGEFGIFSDWRKSIILPESGESIRGDRCLTEEHQDEVQKILARRQETSRTQRVRTV